MAEECRTEVAARGDDPRALYCVTHETWVFGPYEVGLNPGHTIVRPEGWELLDLPPGV